MRNSHALTRIDLCLTGGRNVHSSLCMLVSPVTDLSLAKRDQLSAYLPPSLTNNFPVLLIMKGENPHGLLALHTPREERELKLIIFFLRNIKGYL